MSSALDAARRSGGQQFRFVDHLQRPPHEAYESYIHRTCCIPTRDNLHDLFNGLMWLSYPLTKRRMNEMQAREIERLGVSGKRGPVRDALTLLDENGALLQAPAELVQAIHLREWRRAFLDLRAEWQHARIILFGHALLEKLMQPRKAITAHMWVVDDLRDSAVAQSIVDAALSPRFLHPLPVLGIPGWCSGNDDPAFYDDLAVFRPATARGEH